LNNEDLTIRPIIENIGSKVMVVTPPECDKVDCLQRTLSLCLKVLLPYGLMVFQDLKMSCEFLRGSRYLKTQQLDLKQTQRFCRRASEGLKRDCYLV
jgi:hypothetical protein